MSILRTLLEKTGIVKWDTIEPEEKLERQQRAYTKYLLHDTRGDAYEMYVDAACPLDYFMSVIALGHKGKGKGKLVAMIRLAGLSQEKPDTLVLGDIQITDKTYRHRGLGTTMLRKLFEIARDNGAKYIEGIVVARDIADTPGLLDWYRREGFVVHTNARETQAKLWKAL